MFWSLFAPHFAALLVSAVISSLILNYFVKLFYIWYMQNHFYLTLKDSNDGVLQWAWLMFWALSAVLALLYHKILKIERAFILRQKRENNNLFWWASLCWQKQALSYRLTKYIILAPPYCSWRWKQTQFLEHCGTENLETLEWTMSETPVKCNHFLLLQFTFTVSEIKLKQLYVFHPFQNFMSTHFTTPSKRHSCWRKA